MARSHFEKSTVVALLVLNGSHAGARFSLPDVPTVLGRSAEAHHRLDDPWISNMHALFEQRGPATWVVDLDSCNGTFVDRSRVSEAPLAVGQLVTFGRTEVRVEASAIPLEAPAASPSPAPFLLDSIRTTVRTGRPETPLDLKPRPLAVLRLSLAPSGDGTVPPAALEAAAQAVMRGGGRTTPHLASDLVAVFGLGGASPGDAAQALRAAADLRQALEAAFPALGVRLAVDFGPTVAGIITGPDGAELVVGGEAVDRAERILAEAAPGEILAGPGVPPGADARLEPSSGGGPGLPLRRLRRG
jgi:hypothetical protein